MGESSGEPSWKRAHMTRFDERQHPPGHEITPVAGTGHEVELHLRFYLGVARGSQSKYTEAVLASTQHRMLVRL